MKSEQQIKPASIITRVVIISMCLIGTFCFIKQFNSSSKTTKSDVLLADNILTESSDIAKKITTETEIKAETVETESNDENNVVEETVVEEEPVVDPIVYDGLTRQQLIDKLNRNLNSTLSGKGELFADYALQLGLDPYLAVAIVLHETGCSWDCSDLVKYCNNVGGQKGSPSCGNGSYRAYATLDEGIRGYMNNLYNNYYALGLTTPEAINPKYAASTTWASKINSYIQKIRAS